MSDEPFCYLTTTGRRSGNPHRVELWFGHPRGSTYYLLSGGGLRSDWTVNALAHPAVTFEVGGVARSATARLVTDAAEQELARDALYSKYQPGNTGDLTGWRRDALPLAIDVEADS